MKRVRTISFLSYFFSLAMGCYPMHEAIKKHDYKKVESLIIDGHDIEMRDRSGYSPLLIAVAWNNASIVQLFIHSGANPDAPDSRGTTPLMQAAYNGYTEIVKTLVGSGAHVNLKNDLGWTALHHGASSIAIVALLLEADASVDEKDMQGNTALMYCLDAHAAELLVKRKADVNAANMFSQTALMRASGNHIPGVVKTLLNNGARVNVKDTSGLTALFYAIDDPWRLEYEQSIEVVSLLLSAGANFDIRNRNGDTPIQLARAQRKTRTVELLQKHGAN